MRLRDAWLKIVVAAALMAGMTLVGGAQASASSGLDLSTPAAINNYLVSIGVNPSSAVWQQSLNNYAGPSCPGIGWNCVGTNAPVVQLALPGGTNTFDCAGVSCVVVQSAPSSGQNSADCKRTDSQNHHGPEVIQSCDITQVNTGNPNSTNNASIEQDIEQSGDACQTAVQEARITQDNGVGANHAVIHQKIVQSSKVSGSCDSLATQDQEAHQGATVNQTTNTGDNSSNIDQSQKQDENASGGSTTTQNQNATNQTDPTCDQPGETSDQTKNQCALVTQNSDLVSGGDQDSTLTQGITETATSSNGGNLTQIQGTPTGGQSGDKDQHSGGVSTSHANETVDQKETATGTFTSPPGQRTQDTGDPRCCQFQENNLDDRAFITQKTDQTASPPIDDQFATLQGDCDTTGLCILDQSATTDYDHKTNSDSGMILHEGIECFGAGEEGGCEVVGFGD